jgi:pimeloyl-ACP methyl ester carboxylesterase
MANHPITIESAGGEYMESVLVIAWSVKPGERVKSGDLLVTVETAKAASEIEADRDGWLAEVHFSEGEEAPVGAVLGTISDSEPQPAGPLEGRLRTSASVAAGLSTTPDASGLTQAPTAPIRQVGARVIASPLARRLARQAGLDLETVTGTGPHGRIKQRDIEKAIANRAMPGHAVSTEASAAALKAVRGPHSVPIVFLHGFGADRFVWRQVLPLLGTEFQTITPDLPAHGSSASVPARGVEDLAHFISDQLEAEGIERAHVVGHSLGGATALFLSSIGRIAVQSMTLLAPGGLGPDINGGFISGLTRSTTATALERWLALMLGDQASLPQGYAAAVLRQMGRAGNRTALQTLADRLFADDTQLFDSRPSLQKLTVPTRIVWGRADRVIPATHAERAPDYAAVHLLSGVGHVPQMEVPALTARLILETVRSAA